MLALIVPRQIQRANLASETWEKYCHLFIEHISGYPVVLSQLADSAEDQDITIVLPDIKLEFPISWESDVHLSQELSTYLTWSFPHGLPQVQIVRKAELTPSELARSLRLLKDIDHPLAPYVSDRVQDAVAQP